tara:strand:+ start:403 stop:978 length:576 start_codon:yes stop_codon:yes gene_type:complete
MNFIESFFMDDVSVCDHIIKYFKKAPEKYKHKGTSFYHNYMDGVSSSVVDPDIKDSLDMNFEYDTDIGQAYGDHLDNCIKEYIKKYPDSNTCTEWGIDEPVKIQYYKPGGGFKKFHSERNSKGNNRHLVFMTYLNDVTDGGETEFRYQNLKIKAEKGKTVIWPVDWTYTHRGIVSSTQEKYIVTGWYSFLC